MEMTVLTLAEWFKLFNEKYFQNKLIQPYFVITTRKSFLGRYSVRNKKDVIKISIYFKRSEKEYQQTLIHEMIHCFIYQQKIKDTSAHGREFKRIASEINRDGWNIQRLSDVSHCDANVQLIKPSYLLHYLRKKTNEELIAYIAENSVKRINSAIECGDYENIEILGWYYGKSPKIATLKKSIKVIHGYKVTQDIMKDFKSIEIK